MKKAARFIEHRASSIWHLLLGKARDFANEAAEAAQDFIFVANESKRDGDWVMLAPYGDFPNPKGVQRITRQDGEELANQYRSWLNIPQWVVGAPVYKGHPDHEQFRGQPGHTDTEAVGRVKGLEARADGIFANVKWNERGRGLIENEAFSHPSVNWAMARRTDGTWRPVRLKSVGLTNTPNIPVPAITVANEISTEGNKGNEVMKKIAKRLGLAEDATEEQIDAALSQREADLANERTARGSERAARLTADRERETAETNFANEQKETNRLKTGLQTAETQLQGARKKAASVLIAAAMTAGKVLPAEKAQWETDFANATDFDAVEKKLESAKVKANTQSHRTDNLGTRNATGADRRQVIQDFVNERMDKHGEDYTTAYKSAMRVKPELFAQENAEN